MADESYHPAAVVPTVLPCAGRSKSVCLVLDRSVIWKAAPLGSFRRRPLDVAAADENKGWHYAGAAGAEITHASSAEIDDVLEIPK